MHPLLKPPSLETCFSLRLAKLKDKENEDLVTPGCGVAKISSPLRGGETICLVLHATHRSAGRLS